MPSVLFGRVGQFFSAFNAHPNFNVPVNQLPAVDQTEARLTVRINATEDELVKTRQELEDEKTRSKKWERRAVVASADLAATKSTTPNTDLLQKQLDAAEHDKVELEHRVTRLSRMLTVAEEQRGVAIARLAGFAGGIEDVQEENRILKGTVKALEDELDCVRDCWQTKLQEMEMELIEWENKETMQIEHVKTLQGKLEDFAIEKRTVEEKLSAAQAQLLDVAAGRCLLSLQRAEKERLIERIEELSDTAEKIPNLENDNRQLQAEIHEGKRRLESLSKLLVTMKMKNDELVVTAREKEQYGDSMAQMFADMKKECERLRRERDEKVLLCQSMLETHNESRLKQGEAIEALQNELGIKVNEAAAFQTSVKQLKIDSETKDRTTQEYFKSYNKIASFMNLNLASENALPDFEDMEFMISSLVNTLHDRKAEVTVLQTELHLQRKENQSKEENAKKLSVEFTRANLVQTEMKERIDTVEEENVRLHERSSAFEAQISKLTKTNEAVEKRMDELAIENDTLERRIAHESSVSKALQDERDIRNAELKSMQASIAAEREEMASQLVERSASFASLEMELKDARETYRKAAKNFEARRPSLTRRLTASEQRKEAVEHGLVPTELFVNGTIIRGNEFTKRCPELEGENNGLKESDGMRVFDDYDGDILILREMLEQSENERERLRKMVSDLQRVHSERRLSSSSVSSDEDMARRVQELEMTLEEEAREKEAQKQQLCEAERSREVLKQQVTDLELTSNENEKEAEKLRGEMASIYSRMRKMACVSLPPGAEELLEEEDDRRRLNEIREVTRNEENARAERENRDGVRECRKLPAQKRKVRIGVLENKTRFRG